MIAVIMAGGKATRFRQPAEKAVLRVGGRSLLERAADALSVSGIERVMVAASPGTPQTCASAERLGIEVASTTGVGYHEDILELMGEFGRLVTLNVDVPFVTRKHVERMLERREEGSLTAVLPERLAIRRVARDSVMVDGSGRTHVWIGLNVVTADPSIKIVEYDDPLLAVNVNNEEDLAFADETAVKYGR